jgi:hypothetical protein
LDKKGADGLPIGALVRHSPAYFFECLPKNSKMSFWLVVITGP